MIEFLNAMAPVFYIFLIVSSVVFGVSQAVNLWLVKTVNKIRKEVNKNYSNSLSDSERVQVELAINTAKSDYVRFNVVNAKNKKIKRKNKINKFFKLNEKPLIDSGVDLKGVFVNLVKELYIPFSVVNGVERGYLNFTKNEIFSILRTLTFRVNEIFSKSGVSWIKYVKVSFIVGCIHIYKIADNFFEKLWVLIIFKMLNFFIWFGRLFNVASISKFYIKSLSNQSLEYVIYNLVIEIIGKELAVIYKNERNSLEKENKTDKILN